MTRYLHAAAAAAAVLMVAGTAQAQDTVRLQLQSAFPTANPLVGTSLTDLVERLDRSTDGAVQIRAHEPGALVAPLEAFDAASIGSIDMVWSVAGNWSGKDTAFNFYGSLPFGPGIGEYMAWLHYGGGQELLEELYHSHNIHPMICGMASPEGSGWFKEEIDSLDDLEGLKMRFFGLGARVMEKMGASTQLIPAGEIYQALQLGTIDATEFSTPIQDLALGFHQVAKYYYMPGWHQQSTAMEMLINKDKWDGLSEQQQAQIEMACKATLADSIAFGESVQFEALQEMQEEHGVELKRWPDEFLEAFRTAWEEVVEEESASNPTFAKTWKSYSEFRDNYTVWRELGYVQ